MSDEIENRKLDAWIAENVMGCRVRVNPHSNTLECGCVGHPHCDGTDLGELYGDLARPTTDPAAAMMVLERCEERFAKEAFSKTEFEGIALICIRKSTRNDGHCVFVQERVGEYWHATKQAEAATLPLAICRFAHALFSTQAVKR